MTIKDFLNLFLSFLVLIVCHADLVAHEIRPAYLRIQEVSPLKYEAFWKVPMVQGKYIDIFPQFENDIQPIQTKEQGLSNALIKVYSFTSKQPLKGTSIRIENLDKTLIDVLIQIDFIDETSYSFLVHPSEPSTFVPEDSGFFQVIKTYFVLGVEHIWMGYDHLLFVLGLFLLIPSFGALVKTITSFTIAHSITLIIATLGWISVPSGPVEAVIALSIVLLALEAYNYQKGKTSITIRYPWIVAFAFGLIHGLGFAGALSEIGLPQKSIPSALLFFNVGVEFGQVVFVGLLWFLFFLLRKYTPVLHKWAKISVPYAIGSLGMFWVIERISGF